MTGRTVNDWCGATPDTAVPDRVRLRVFEKNGGCCQICQRKLYPGDKWICDHKQAIINGGQNQEGNLQTICDWCDKRVKTPADVAEKSRSYQRRLSHAGIKRKKQPFGGWRKFDGSPVRNPRAVQRT